jgi:dTDP-3-amino-3,4,6-trideoxy-alpha-D-glucose transaminase
MKVPFLSWSARLKEEKPLLLQAFERTLDSGLFVLGPEVEKFENAFAKEHAIDPALVVSCNSGTDALILGLKALGVSLGDEVIVPSHTAVPTISAIEAVGAIPRFADIDDETWVISLPSVKKLLTKKTKCIIAVHLYGNMVDIPALLQLGVPVIEDVAQAQGSRWKGHWAGTLGAVGAFSFYPTKNLGALGDGGLFLSREKFLAEQARMLRFYGQKTRYQAELPQGINSRLDELQAAVLSLRLTRLAEDHKKKKNLVQSYRSGLEGLPVVFQRIPAECDPHWHLFVVATESHERREGLKKFLEESGIGSLIHYQTPNHLQPAFSRYRRENLPVTEDLSKRILSLPLYADLSPDSLDYVVTKVKEFFSIR